MCIAIYAAMLEVRMRRIPLLAWLVLSSAAICGGVVAMEPLPVSVAAQDVDKARPPAAADFPLPKGHIVAVDDRTGTIIIRHKGVRRFELPAQTCAFKVDDPALLTGLTAGDKIRFDLERVNGRYVVTHIENSN
jgi:Cu/Ag efflux protein CusF